MLRWIFAGLVLGTIGNGIFLHPQAGIALTLVFLAVLGDARRALIPAAGWSSHDPILLVGPALALLVLAAPNGRPLRLDTPLSRAVALLMVLMLVQMANPLQGGLEVGLAGALFYVVPLLWYWVGRRWATPPFLEPLLFRVVVPVAVLAALLGIYQALHGLLPYEQAWVETSGYAALSLAGFTRPFAFFTSSAEYAHYLAMAIALLWARFLRGTPLALAWIPLLFGALFLEASRGAVVRVAFVAAVLWAVQARSRSAWPLRLGLALCLGCVGLVWSLQEIDEAALDGRLAVPPALVQHQTEGLLQPGDGERSTLGLHVAMVGRGLSTALEHPLGLGLGSTTLAASKFGGRVESTEMDLSDVLLSLGLAGGALYLFIMAAALARCTAVWRRSRALLPLAVGGLITVHLGSWLHGGEYATTALDWICIGAIDAWKMAPKGGSE